MANGRNKTCKILFVDTISVDSLCQFQAKIRETDNMPKEGRRSIINSILGQQKYYDYSFAADMELNPGDIAVIEATERRQGRPQIRRLCVGLVAWVDTEPLDVDVEPYAYVYDTIDTSKILAHKALIRTLANLEMKMAAREKESSEIARFKRLADTDPEMAALVEEYEKLRGK